MNRAIRLAVMTTFTFAQVAGAQKYGGVSTPATMKSNPYTASGTAGAGATNPYTGAAPTAPPTTAPAFKPDELEAICAPIALYPDSLLAQVFMASTYPLEIVQADRWVKQNPSVKGDALA